MLYFCEPPNKAEETVDRADLKAKYNRVPMWWAESEHTDKTYRKNNRANGPERLRTVESY